MKKSITILAVLVAVLAVFLFASCEEVVDALSAQDCMEGFVDDANDGNFDDLKDYLHSDAQRYSQADADFWYNELSNHTPLDLGTVTEVYAEATGSDGTEFTFTLDEDADDDDSIKITGISREGTPIFFNVK